MARLLFRLLARGLLARSAGYGLVGFGFWLLYRGFGQSGMGAGIGMGLGGAGSILAGMILLVSVGRHNPGDGPLQPNGETGSTPQEVSSVDPVDGSNQGG